jgi:hypothetical protein
MTIEENLDCAKRHIEAGETNLRAAAEHLAAARKQGASQRQMAGRLGKSPPWVNRLLKWHDDGYGDETPFGPQAKASRQRAKGVQATERKKQKPATTSEQARAAAARARAEQAKAEAQKARADAAKAKADAAKAKAEARKATVEEEARMHDAFRAAFGMAEKKPLHSGPRELLVKALGMLGSDHAGERDNAARMIEKLRREQLGGMTWEELIIPADDAENRMAA